MEEMLPKEQNERSRRFHSDTASCNKRSRAEVAIPAMPSQTSSNISKKSPGSASSGKYNIVRLMNFIVLVLSVVLIVWISVDTFEEVDFLDTGAYMKFQLWVCIFFILDFFVEWSNSSHKGRFFRSRLLFLLLSIPYLNIISHTGLQLSHNALYLVRFIPLARGALAIAIVFGYLSKNAITSLFVSYISIMVLAGYFGSLIFFQWEHGVNSLVNSYWDALWWSAMNMAAAIKDPSIIKEGAEKFGNQCIVLAVDAKRNGENSWEVYINGGRTPTGIDCLEWVKKAVSLGAGEILLTSMDADGTKNGYDIPLTRAVSEAVNVPVIASGGAGKLEHFYEVLTEGKADAVLAASVFHYGEFSIRQVKEYLKSRGVEVRL